MDRRRTARPRHYVELLPVVVAAVLLRLPLTLSRAPINFDDGVYLASVGAMRAGGLPFQDVYSSQGPAFLPLLWLADLVGLRTQWAPRLLPLVAGAVLVVIVHRLARGAGDRWGAFLAALIVATSGSVLFATGRIKSDGVAVALVAGAILAAAGSGSGSGTRRRDLAAAVLLGLGLAVKSLFVGPAALAVVWLIWRRRGWRTALLVSAGSVVVLLALALLWGIGDVWDQSFGFHLVARGHVDIRHNVSLLRETARRYERMLVWLAITAVGAAAWRRSISARRPLRPDRDLAIALWIWLIGSVAVVLLDDPVFLQHYAIVVVPAALLVARHRPPALAAAAVVLLVLPIHAQGAGWRLTSPRPTHSEQDAIERLRQVVPADGLVISDEPTLPWLADRTSPGSMVDLGYVRIEAGDLTTAEVVDAADRPGVCAILFWSGRLDALPGLRGELVDYRSVFRDGRHELLLRTGCR